MKFIGNRQSQSRHVQRGFGMALALAVLAIFAVIAAAISLANRGGTQKTDQETAKAMAESIVSRGNEIFASTVRASQDRDIKNMVLATSGVSPVWGLYNPTFGFASDVTIPGKAFSTATDTSFSLDKTNIKIIGIGSAGSDQVAVAAIVPDVTTAACSQINRLVQGVELDAAIPTVTNGTAIALIEGCATINTKFTYYKVLGSSV